MQKRMIKNMDEAKKQLKFLPSKLREELYNEQEDDIHSSHEFYNLYQFNKRYYEQLMRLNPVEEAQRLRLANRLEKVINNNL